MRISKQAILNAGPNDHVVGHHNWEEALVLERDSEGNIRHPKLEEGVWFYPIIQSDKDSIVKGNFKRWNLPPGDWTIIYGAFNDEGEIQDRNDCPGACLTFID